MEDPLDAGRHLAAVGREVEPGGRGVVVEAVVGEEVVEPEVAGVVGHVVDAGVGEVAEQVAPVEAGHGDLGHAHLEEGAEGAEDALPPGPHAEAGGG